MKRLFVILPFLLFILISCQNKQTIAELEAFRAQANIEEHNIELAKNLIDEFNNGNVDIWRDLCASEFAYFQPSETTKPLSLEQTIEASQMIYEGFPDYSWNIQELIAKGDRVIARTNFTGTNEGGYRNYPITSKKIKLSIISILRFKDGKCIEIMEEEDLYGFMRQFGFELKLKEEI